MRTLQRIGTLFCLLALGAFGGASATITGSHLFQSFPDGNPGSGGNSSAPVFTSSSEFVSSFNGQPGAASVDSRGAGGGIGIGASLGAKNRMSIINAAPGYYFSMADIRYEDRLTLSGVEPGTQATFNFLLTGARHKLRSVVFRCGHRYSAQRGQWDHRLGFRKPDDRR